MDTSFALFILSQVIGHWRQIFFNFYFYLRKKPSHILIVLASESDALRPSIGPLDHRSWLEDVASQVVDVGWWAGFWKIVIAKIKKNLGLFKKRKYMLAKSLKLCCFLFLN